MQRGQWAEEVIGVREGSDCLAASEASRAVQDRALWSEAERCPNSSLGIKWDRPQKLQGSAKRRVPTPGLLNFVTALAYHFCLT